MKRESKFTVGILSILMLITLAACSPAAQQQVVSGPPPSPPVVYQADAFLVFQKIFETISQAPGVEGWEYTEQLGGVLGVAPRTYTITYGNSGSWSIRQSDRAAGFIRAETTSVPAVNQTSAGACFGCITPEAPTILHVLTVAVSGPDQSGPTQVVVTVSSTRALYMVERIHTALDAEFQRIRR